MTPQIYNEEHKQFISRKIVAIAKNIISGELGVIAGARQLGGLGHYVEAGRDPDFTFFIAIDSETDDLPIGEVRKLWNPEALRTKDAELIAYESSVREKAFEICRRLIQKYEITTDDELLEQ
jgi:hypothetical protein